MAEYNSLSLVLLAEQFGKLPGIGIKTAHKLAYYLLNQPAEQAREFANAILSARENIKSCKICQNMSDAEMCPICEDESRSGTIICVVESPKDVSAFERAGGFCGKYHVLHGLLSPIDAIGPEQIRIKELITRLDEQVCEVIMATNPTVEGEATAMYLSRIIKPMDIKVSRLAYGLPVGASLEYADDVTLQKALDNRNPI